MLLALTTWHCPAVEVRVLRANGTCPSASSVFWRESQGF